MTSQDVRDLGDGVQAIDHCFEGEAGLIASYLVRDGGDVAVIETGPASTAETLRRGLAAADVDPEAVETVMVTHIHLDHAGGAWALLDHLPNATLHVHPRGASHLIDPRRLLSSARRIYGDAMERLWGPVCPVPEERVRVLQDGDTVAVGGRTLRAIDTPGHAGHHHAYHDKATGILFTGDVAGIRLDGLDYVRPPTPPPEIALHLWAESVARIRALRPRRLVLTHGGAYDDADLHLDHLLMELQRWAGRLEMLDVLVEDEEERLHRFAEAADAEIRRHGGDDEAIRRYELSVGYDMNVIGLRRALGRREPPMTSRESTARETGASSPPRADASMTGD